METSHAQPGCASPQGFSLPMRDGNVDVDVCVVDYYFDVFSLPMRDGNVRIEVYAIIRPLF